MRRILFLSLFCLLSIKASSQIWPSDELAATQAMNMDRLREIAFERCQTRYENPPAQAVAELDPPKDRKDESVGLVFGEELAVTSKQIFSSQGFYFLPRPRLALNTQPMDLYVDATGQGIYKHKTWEDSGIDFSSPRIQPPIYPEEIPPAGRVLTELIVGHQFENAGFPQLFDLRANGYLRFAGYPPQISGASMRLAAHGIFERKNGFNDREEDFPVVRAVFTSVSNTHVSKNLIFVESELFCGALDVDMIEGKQASLVVDGYWYTRKDFHWREDRNTGLVAYSSMAYRMPGPKMSRRHDFAHDSDTMFVGYADGHQEKIDLHPPKNSMRIREFEQTSKSEPVSWALAQVDRNPKHYSAFDLALGETNYNMRASYKVDVLEKSVKMGVSLYEHSAMKEYGDNVVGVSTIRQDIPKARNPSEYVRFKYRTTAYWPDDEEASL